MTRANRGFQTGSWMTPSSRGAVARRLASSWWVAHLLVRVELGLLFCRVCWAASDSIDSNGARPRSAWLGASLRPSAECQLAPSLASSRWSSCLGQSAVMAYPRSWHQPMMKRHSRAASARRSWRSNRKAAL